MNYLELIGKKAKKAFEDLKGIKHKKIKKVLENYNQSLLKNTNKLIRENLKDVKNVKRKHLVDRLILNKRRIEGILRLSFRIFSGEFPFWTDLELWPRSPRQERFMWLNRSLPKRGYLSPSDLSLSLSLSALSLVIQKLSFQNDWRAFKRPPTQSVAKV